MSEPPAKPPAQARSGVRSVEVGPEHAARRLDNFLAAELQGAPRAYVYRVIRSGEVRVNGRRAAPQQRLNAGDRIRIPPFTAAPAAAPRLSRSVLANVEARILYEDERLLVLDKPAGIAVHGGSGLDYGLIDVVRDLRPAGGRIDLVHRLDRETSGCLLFARDPATLRRLHEALRAGRMHKAYLALLAGRLPARPIDCRAALAMEPDRHGEKHAVVRPDGMPARTEFRVRHRYDGATLAAVKLDTGRTHQIRAHAAHLGHPVAGDERYGDTEFNRRLKALGLKRLFLHAERLEFVLDRPLSFTAPLPAELAAVLAALGAEQDP
ncbi:MAG TPA: RluA family pseudouridine synthase [Gammaproteobacteria bacterium]|nr:RluA family pseudouridine synthase [Gammaproteobacteria bacterium]